MKSIFLVALFLACAGTERPVCSPKVLAGIEARYVMEVLTACKEHETPEACPEYEGIRKKYKVERDAWKECK